MRLVVYGTLRQGEHLSWILSWASSQHLGKFETIELPGLRIHVVGDCPGAKIGSKGNKAIVELWEFNLPKAKELSFLEMLDQIEGVRDGLYERSYINTPRGKALVYTICENVEKYPQIRDWKEWQKKSYRERMRILMKAGGARVAIYTRASIYT